MLMAVPPELNGLAAWIALDSRPRIVLGLRLTSVPAVGRWISTLISFDRWYKVN